MIIIHMNLGLKLLLCFNRKFFNFQTNPFRYYGFSIVIDTFLCFKGASITRMDTGRNCSLYVHYNSVLSSHL